MTPLSPVSLAHRRDKQWFKLRLFGMIRAIVIGKPINGRTTQLVREAGQELPGNRQENCSLGILDLENVTVNDIMIPRNEVFGIDLNSNLDQIIWQLRTTTHTRCHCNRDNINQIILVSFICVKSRAY